MSLRPSTLRSITAAAVVVAVLAALAVWRGGLLDLPDVPDGLTADRAGLADLEGMRARAQRLERAAETGTDPDSALMLAGSGLAAVRRGEVADGLARMETAVQMAPEDLVIGNAFRMAVLQARRARLAEVGAVAAAGEADAAGTDLEHASIATFEALERDHPTREASLQLALAWVDEILLHRALEIAAPASVESVNHLTALLADDPVYVPALFGRGLNYLHRPARLVWPEARKAAPDAASRDLGLCVAIGRRIGGASPVLVATLALCLGDAYAKEGRPDRARSWWQIARNASVDPGIRAAVERRFGWRDEEMLDRLEDELEHRMQDLDAPLTDLAVMWREAPR